jgi:hypothetical protein
LVCTQKFKVKNRRRVVLKTSLDCELPYEIPQNGILKK